MSKTYINDILVEYSTHAPRGVAFDITTEAVQSVDNQDIIKHVRRRYPNINLECAFTDTDREQKFNQLIDLSIKREPVKLIQSETIENLIITNISEANRYSNVVAFNITFSQIAILNLETTTVPLPESLQQLQRETQEGLQNVQEVSLTPSTYPGVSE